MISYTVKWDGKPRWRTRPLGFARRGRPGRTLVWTRGRCRGRGTRDGGVSGANDDGGRCTAIGPCRLCAEGDAGGGRRQVDSTAKHVAIAENVGHLPDKEDEKDNHCDREDDDDKDVDGGGLDKHGGENEDRDDDVSCERGDDQ